MISVLILSNKQVKAPTDDYLCDIFLELQGKIRLDISCESSAGRFQVLWRDKKMSTAPNFWLGLNHNANIC